MRLLALAGLVTAALLVGTSATATAAGTDSGYVATGSTYTSVSAAWAVPATTCTATSDLSIWVGLDGFDDPTVEQTGVDIECTGRTLSIAGFYELFPAAPVFYGNVVRPGDSISATVAVTGTTYAFTLTDTTQGWSKVTRKSARAADSSAEIIVECGGTCPVFHQVAVNHATVNGQPLANARPTALNGTPGTTSPIAGGGSFTVTQSVPVS